MLLSQVVMSKIVCQKLEVILKSSSSDRGESLYMALESHISNGYIMFLSPMG